MEILGRWLKVGTAAVYAGVCRNTIRKWADSGDIAYQRTPGGKRLIDRESLDTLDPTRAEAIALAREICN